MCVCNDGFRLHNRLRCSNIFFFGFLKNISNCKRTAAQWFANALNRPKNNRSSCEFERAMLTKLDTLIWKRLILLEKFTHIRNTDSLEHLITFYVVHNTPSQSKFRNNFHINGFSITEKSVQLISVMRISRLKYDAISFKCGCQRDDVHRWLFIDLYSLRFIFLISLDAFI